MLRWDPDTRRFLDYQLVQVRPDTTVSVTLAPAVAGDPCGAHPAGQRRDSFTRVIRVTLP